MTAGTCDYDYRSLEVPCARFSQLCIVLSYCDSDICSLSNGGNQYTAGESLPAGHLFGFLLRHPLPVGQRITKF